MRIRITALHVHKNHRFNFKHLHLVGGLVDVRYRDIGYSSPTINEEARSLQFRCRCRGGGIVAPCRAKRIGRAPWQMPREKKVVYSRPGDGQDNGMFRDPDPSRAR